MKPIDIQYELKKRGITQRNIAKKLKVSETMISHVILGRTDSDRVMKAISKRIERDHREVFGAYYDAHPEKAAA